MIHHWYEEALIYHIYPLSFAGDRFTNDYTGPDHKIAEIEKWIPHIAGMGFNTVLFNPLLKSRSHGYDVTDYFEIDNRLGTNDEFQSLVRKFHENGVRVILDGVFNHCGRDFFAFQEILRNNREYAAWFSGVDFSKRSPLGDPFDYGTWSGHYSLPKFNLQNEAVKKYLLEAARFWIDSFDIDGLRLDAADVLDFGFMAELRRVTTEKKPDFWLMGEVVHGDYAKWVNESMLHSVTNYKLYKSLYSSHNNNNLFELANCVKSSVPDNGLPLNIFLDNHDQSRIASIVSSPAYLGTLYTLLFTLPGIPSVYYGGEWGLEGIKEKSSDRNLRPYINIDNRSEYDTWLTGHISRLMRIRRNEDALKYGGYQQIYLAYKRPYVFERYYENPEQGAERIVVAINASDRAETVNISGCCGGRLRDLLNNEQITNPGQIMIKPHSARILKAN